MKISPPGNGQATSTAGSSQFSILFVCTGNTCRSPMAEALARHAAEERKLDGLQIASAGVAALDGEPASPNAQRAMESRGLSLKAHRARRLTPEIAREAGLILTMTETHARAVGQIAPEAKVFTLRGYLGEAGDVADPWGGSEAVYEACACELEGLVKRVLEKFAEDVQS